MATTITVNGKRYRVTAAPNTPLLYVLRNDLQLNGPKFGCGVGACGACMVLIGGRPTRACKTRLSDAEQPIITLEGLGAPNDPHPLQTAFIQEQAVQCGYCTSGMIISAAALLRNNAKPTDAAIRTALNGNLCRCGSHMRILRAVKRAAGEGV
jgi:nicotinate dehydrogenase subunit A